MAPGRGYTAEDLFRLKTVADPQVSPDGARIAYVVTEIDKEGDGYRSSIWLAEEDGEPRQLTLSGKSDTSPRWSPDGCYLAFLSNRAGGPNQLYVMPMDGGEPCKLTDLKRGVSEYAWSPRGDALAATSRVGGTEANGNRQPAKVITTFDNKLNGFGYMDGSKLHVFVAPLDGGEARQVTEGDYDNNQVAWSPDGSAIVFVSAQHENSDRDSIADLWTVPAAGGQPTRVTDRFGDCNAPAFSPDGATIAFVSTGHGETSGRTSYLWVVPAAGGQPRCLSADLGRSIQAGGQTPYSPPAPVYWTADGTGIVARVHDRADIHLYHFALEDGSRRTVVGGDRAVTAFSLSRDGQLAFVASDQTTPGEVYRTDLSRHVGEPQKVSAANDALVSELRFPEIEEIAVTTPSGAVIEGWVIKPLDFQPGRKYPLVIDIHGGPHGAFQHAFQGSYPLSLSALGCAVVQMNPTGSTGWGEAFAKGIHTHRGELDFPEQMASVDHVVAQGWVDEDRLGVTGYSYGGYMTGWTVTHTDRFKAGVWGAGVCDLYSFFAYTDNNVPRYHEMGGPPWENRELYLRLSPISYVQNAKTPLLMMHGEADLRCNTFQSDQFFTALRYYGVEVELVRFPGEHHGFRQSGKPSNRYDYDRRLLEWFKERLALER